MINNRKLEIQKLDPYEDEWTTGDIEFMSKEQLFKAMHSTMNGLLKTILGLKKELKWGKFVDDVVRREVVNSLLKEFQKRFFNKEVIPVKN
jgi:hypothetical protein